MDNENSAAGQEHTHAIEDVKRQFFVGDDQEKEAQAAVNVALQAANAAKFKPVMNFDPSEQLPVGYGIAILPVDQKNKVKGEKQVRVGLGICAMPSPQLLMDSTEEPIVKWRNETLQAVCMNKLANAIRPTKEGESGPSSIPFSLHDFATSNRGATTAVWKAVAPAFLKAIKQKAKGSFNFVTLDMFRLMLQNTSYAKQTTKVAQEKWVEVIGAMKQKAMNAGLSTEVFDDMLETRDDKTFEIEDINFDDFDAI